MQRHVAPVTFEDRDAATGWLRREKRLIDDDEWTPPALRKQDRQAKGQTFGEYAEQWLARRRRRDGSPLKDRTRAHYRTLLDTRLLPAFGETPLRHISPQAIADWHDELAGHQTPTYTAHAYALLHAIMASAAKPDANGRALVPSNPCQLEGAQRAKTVHEVEVIDQHQADALVQNMAPQYRLAIALMFWCALRFGETVALERGDIDRRNGVLRIRRGVVRVNGEQRLDSPKNGKTRTVAYPPHLDALIADHLDNYAEPGRTGKLFPSQSGGWLSQSTLNGKPARVRRIRGRMVNESATGFRKAADAIGRPDLRLHDLRHSGATLAARFGTVGELQERLGHSTPMAAMRYQHAAQGRDAEIARKMSELMGV